MAGADRHAYRVAVGEARPAQLDPEVALKRREVLDRHEKRGVVGRVRGKPWRGGGEEVGLDSRERRDDDLQ